MALTAAQKVTVAEITYEEYATIDGLVDDLTAEQETSIIADIATWATIRDSHVKLKGGSDGVDFDNARKREAIRVRIRIMFGLPPVSPDDPSYESFQLVDMEVGANFG